MTDIDSLLELEHLNLDELQELKQVSELDLKSLVLWQDNLHTMIEIEIARRLDRVRFAEEMEGFDPDDLLREASDG